MGDFCPNRACPSYGIRQTEQAKANIIKFGRSRQGRQRYRCKTCGQAFCETTGTLFHNRKTPEGEIIECLAMLAEGMRISSISRVKGIKEDTILDWIRSAGAHAEAIETVLLAEYELSRGQLDGSIKVEVVLQHANNLCPAGNTYRSSSSEMITAISLASTYASFSVTKTKCLTSSDGALLMSSVPIHHATL